MAVIIGFCSIFWVLLISLNLVYLNFFPNLLLLLAVFYDKFTFVLILFLWNFIFFFDVYYFSWIQLWHLLFKGLVLCSLSYFYFYLVFKIFYLQGVWFQYIFVFVFVNFSGIIWTFANFFWNNWWFFEDFEELKFVTWLCITTIALHFAYFYFFDSFFFNIFFILLATAFVLVLTYFFLSRHEIFAVFSAIILGIIVINMCKNKYTKFRATMQFNRFFAAYYALCLPLLYFLVQCFILIFFFQGFNWDTFEGWFMLFCSPLAVHSWLLACFFFNWFFFLFLFQIWNNIVFSHFFIWCFLFFSSFLFIVDNYLNINFFTDWDVFYYLIWGWSFSKFFLVFFSALVLYGCLFLFIF